MNPALTTVLLAAPAFAQSELPNDGSIGPSSLVQNGEFGGALAAEGDWAVVGATREAAGLAGRVELFQRVGGAVFSSRSEVVGDVQGDLFGAAVAIDVDGVTPVVLVGTPASDQQSTDAGIATLYEFVGGVLQPVQDLTPGDPQQNSFFGSAVATDAGVFAVGRPAFTTGSVYLYDGSGSGIMDLPLVVATVGENGARFGSSLALEGDLLAVGAPLTDSAGTDGGAVYLYEQAAPGAPFSALFPLSNAMLVGAEVSAGDEFGASVALEGDVLVVGAPQDGPGSAYVFRRQPNGSFLQEQRLTAPGLSGNANFGAAVAVAGGRLAIGAPQDSTLSGETGATYVFEELVPGSWVLVWKGVLSGASTNSRVGATAAVAEDLVFSGAPGFDDLSGSVTTVDAGVVGVFTFGDDVCLSDQVNAATTRAGDRLGASLAGLSDGLYAGQPLDDDGGSQSGSVAFFESSGGGWTYTSTLVNPQPLPDSRFGASLSAAAGRVAIGAPSTPSTLFNPGEVIVFDALSGGGHGNPRTLTAESPMDGDLFGASVALSSGSLVVGAPGSMNGSGDVHLFDLVDGAGTFLRRPFPASTALTGDGYGSAVARNGGLLAVGSPGADGGGMDRGAVELFARRALEPSIDFDITAGEVGALGLGSAGFTTSFAHLGDLDGDGSLTLAIGLPDATSPGGVLEAGDVLLVEVESGGVLSGATSLIHGGGGAAGCIPLDGRRIGGGLATGDFDGDGDLDLAVGTPGDGIPGFSGGVAFLWLDGAGNRVGCSLLNTSFLAPNDFGGSSLACLGDVDGNGVDDLAVGVPRFGALDEGAVFFLYLPGGDAPVITVDGMAQGGFSQGTLLGSAATDGAGFGSELAVLSAEVGGEQQTWLAIGAETFDFVDGESSPEGAVCLVSLESNPPDWTLVGLLDASKTGAQSMDAFGDALVALGDIDGNGVDDLLVGASGLGLGPDETGGVVVLQLGPDGSIAAGQTWQPDPADFTGLQGTSALGTKGLAFPVPGAEDEPLLRVLLAASSANAAYGLDLGFGYESIAALTAPNGANSARLGGSVDLTADLLIAGAIGDDAGTMRSGLAHAWDLSGPSPVHLGVLEAAEPVTDARFGTQVEIRGDEVWVSAPGSGAAGAPAGSLHRFEQLNAGGPFFETLVVRPGDLAPSGMQTDDRAGESFALVGNSLLVGAPDRDVPAVDAGTIFDISLTGACQPVLASMDFVSLQDGGVQVIDVQPGGEFAGEGYWTLASLQPGATVLAPGVTLPLAMDDLFELSLASPNVAPFLNTFGLLDDQGAAQSLLELPAGLPSSLNGVRLHAAYATFSVVSLTASFASEAVVFEFVP